MHEPFDRPRRNWPQKFAAAFRAMALGARGESSFRVHGVFALLAVAAGVLLRVSRLEWCLLVLCIAVVLAAEMFNSALERLAKAIDDRYNQHLADGLDIASAAVLLAALGAVAVGLLIFLFRLGVLLGWW